jgi:UDP-N-acetylmuramoyl-L-alanyl-D-glutamate--2,6-diaminopimelate ligase
MLLSRILTNLDVIRLHGESDPDVTHVTRDSREVGAGSLFCAIAGQHFDGHTVASGLTQAGVLVVQSWVDPPPGVVVVMVKETRAALGVIASLLAGEPSKQLRLVGVTGTNGKTTITTFVDDALNAVGVSSGRIGTTGAFVRGKPIPSALTTPESPMLQKTLHEMVKEDVHVASLEVSSIGLDQRRLDGCQFEVAVFTNISRDHLDYHETMDAYLQAKSRLFTDYLRPIGGLPRALVCADDPRSSAVGAPEDHWAYGFSSTADVRIVALQTEVDATHISLETPVGPVVIKTQMLGKHNAQNIAGALAIGLMLGVPSELFANALGRTAFVRGRLERVASRSGALIVIDYAHTPHALEIVLQTLRDITSGRIIVVFGCGGDRDSGKRSAMGRVAGELADVLIVTNDNPRSEDPQQIADDILKGVVGDVTVTLDRQIAVTRAVEIANAGDTVLIAGKGHETTQVIGDQVIPMDDRVLVSKAQGAP